MAERQTRSAPSPRKRRGEGATTSASPSRFNLRVCVTGAIQSRRHLHDSISLDNALASDHAHILKEMIDAPDDVDESGAFARIDAAWARQIDSDDFPHAARPRGHDNDAVGEKDRLLDAVGDKDHSLTGGLPDILQIDLQLRTRER